MEVYKDDILVKSKEEFAYLDDLEETFTTLRQYQMKLNPSKYAFGVVFGKFLGFMVSQKGIEANPKKSHIGDDITKDGERSPKTNREDSTTQQVRL